MQYLYTCLIGVLGPVITGVIAEVSGLFDATSLTIPLFVAVGHIIDSYINNRKYI